MHSTTQMHRWSRASPSTSALRNRPRPHGTLFTSSLALEFGQTLTVFVVDDDRAIRGLIRDLLQESGYAVEAFADGESFLQSYRPNHKGCLLVDVLLPGMNGIELIEHIKEQGHGLSAVVMSGYAGVPMAVRAMKAGAVDFVEKPVASASLLTAIKSALGRALTDTTSSTSHKALCLASLTRRQRQVLDFVLEGYPTKIIAADLGISQRTVDNHRAAIMRKTGSKSIPELVRTALAAS